MGPTPILSMQLAPQALPHDANTQPAGQPVLPRGQYWGSLQTGAWTPRACTHGEGDSIVPWGFEHELLLWTIYSNFLK
jgi:hypothetical protein